MTDWQHAGEVAVDAGLIMVGDPCYAAEKDHPIHDWDKFCSLIRKDSDGWATQLKFNGTTPGQGVVVSSGYGDGIYPVYIKLDDHGDVAEVKVVFIGENDDDQCDED